MTNYTTSDFTDIRGPEEKPKERKLSSEPDPWMQWIYEPEYANDPQAKDLRERRSKALASVPSWMRPMGWEEK